MQLKALEMKMQFDLLEIFVHLYFQNLNKDSYRRGVILLPGTNQIDGLQQMSPHFCVVEIFLKTGIFLLHHKSSFTSHL